MTEIEVPLEKSQEDIFEKAHAHDSNGPKWFSWVALSSAILAVIAAISALNAGHHANEALIEQIHSSDQWSYYQAKGIKSAVLNSKNQMLEQLGKKVNESDLLKVEEYKKEQEEISVEAKQLGKNSTLHLKTHETFATAVTFFQISIAISAISILIRRRRFWLLSLGFAAIGTGFFIQGFLSN
jgi:hypothetical protein